MAGRELFRTERMLAFSDGVFAVAITLLVLDLRVQGLHRDASDDALLQALLEMWPKFLTFATSFLVIGLMWIAHHRKFSYIERVDHRMIWLNIVFLLILCLVPFASALLSEFGNRTATLAYMLTMGALSLASAALSALGLSRQDFAAPHLTPGIRRDLILSPLASCAIFLLAALLAFVNLNFARYSLILLIPASIYAGARKAL